MTATTKPRRQREPTDLDALEQAAEILKTLAHPDRLQIVQMLLKGQYTVGELAAACGIPPSVASEHVRLMQRAGLLTCEKDGRRRFYHVTERFMIDIISVIKAGFCQPA